MMTYFMFNQWNDCGEDPIPGYGILWNLIQWLTPKQETYLHNITLL